MKKIKLNLGCGDVSYKGWTNIDIDSKKADLIHDLRKPLPYKENSVDFIYNEHFIEHLTVEEGLLAFKDYFRVLKPGGVLRLATPDLDYIVRKYILGWKKQDWIKRYGYDWIQTKSEMMNIYFHAWEHKYLYNFEELSRRLKESSFKEVNRKKLTHSDYKDLINLETRKDSKLIVEAIKQ